MQVLGGIVLTPINPLIGSGFISSGLVTGMTALQDENYTSEAYFKSASMAFASSVVTGGTAQFIGPGFNAAFISNGLGKTISTGLECFYNNQALPSYKYMLKDFCVGGISGSIASTVSDATHKVSNTIMQVIQPAQSRLARILAEGVKSSVVSASNQLTAIVTTNVITQEPISKNLLTGSILANAAVAGAVGSLQAYNAAEPTLANVKIVRRKEDGSEIILWSGSSEDYISYKIEEHCRSLVDMMNDNELAAMLAELSGQIKKVKPLVPEDQWNRPITAQEIINNAKNNNSTREARARYLSDVMACLLWGGDPTSHDSAAKAFMEKKFMDNQKNPKHTDKRLLTSVTAIMNQAAASKAVKPLIEQYEYRLPLTETTARLYNVPQEDIMTQVFIEKTDQLYRAEDYGALTEKEKIELTLIVRRIILGKTENRDKKIIDATMAQTRVHYQGKNPDNVEGLLRQAEQTANAIAQREMVGQEKIPFERKHKKSTKVVKHAERIIKNCIQGAIREGIGVNVSTNGNNIVATLGPAKEVHHLTVYDSSEKNKFTEALDTAVNTIAQDSHASQPSSSNVSMENIATPKSNYYVPSPPKKVTHSQAEKRRNVVIKKENNTSTSVYNEQISTEATQSSAPANHKKGHEQEGIDLGIKTKKTESSINKKGRKQLRDPKTGRFVSKQSQVPVKKMKFLNKPEYTSGANYVGRTADITYIAPDPSAKIQVGLAQSTQVFAVKEKFEENLSVFVTADSHLKVIDTGEVMVDVFAANLSATASKEEIGFSAQASAVKAQTAIETQEKCHKGSCAKTIATFELHGGSVGARAGFGQKRSQSGVKTTKISAGIGLGFFGFATRLEIESWNENNDKTQTISELPDIKRRRK